MIVVSAEIYVTLDPSSTMTLQIWESMYIRGRLCERGIQP